MNDGFRSPLRAFLTATLLLLVSVNLSPASLAEDPSERVPEPLILEQNKDNVWGEINGTPTQEYFINKERAVTIHHGDVMTLISVRNITQGDFSTTDYQCNVHYRTGGWLYIAQFQINNIDFNIGGSEIGCSLECDEFDLVHTPLVYDGEVATFDVDISFEGIRVSSGLQSSKADLTLFNHVRADWNNTHIKVEAQFDLNDTRFYQSGGAEYNAGEPFTAQIGYGMMLSNPEAMRISGPIMPSQYTNATMVYNITLEDGSPIVVSRLDMRDSFTIYNATGAIPSTGYSVMTPEPNRGTASVVHGFPNLIYKDTQSIRSDPELTIYHDKVTTSAAADYNLKVALVITVIVAVVIAAIAGVLLIRRRRKRSKEGGVKKP